MIEQFNILSEWMDKNFPDVEFTIEFNDDHQNPVQPAFHIKSRLFTKKHMTENDQLLRHHHITITPEIWDDSVLMNRFIKNIVPSFQRSITKEVNEWYHKQKHPIIR